jgi:hypothetical protein
MNDLTIGFLFGIIGSIIATMLLNFILSRFFSKLQYRKYLGKYSHPNGTVQIKHLKGDYFQVIGKENNGIIWNSNLKYLNNSVFVGVYDWQPCSGLDEWGEHHLHILPNGNISVIWINKSVEKEAKGRLIWIKEN